MKSAAGLAMHRFVGAGRIAWRGFVRKPVLHVHAGPGTLEDEVSHIGVQLDDYPVPRVDPCQYGRTRTVQAGLAAELQTDLESFAWGGATKTLKWQGLPAGNAFWQRVAGAARHHRPERCHNN